MPNFILQFFQKKANHLSTNGVTSHPNHKKLVMKKLALVLLVAVGSQVAKAQSGMITPGKSAGMVEIGMTEENIIELVGEPCAKRTHQEEDSELIKFGRSIWHELRYNTHYDKVYEYEGASIPVKKMYFKDGKLVYMTLTAFGYDQAMLENFMVSPQACMNCPMDAVTSYLGYPEFTEDNTHVKQMFYLNKGIDFIALDGDVKVINIYAPIDENLALAIKEATGY